ncbi:mitochondrial 37S ribosomal uS8m domain-containing protein [Cenococcum geophilum 1.58]|uniref:mitochondrial 37S ribosomal uS8m domain-containing protein n=1 Tax=Cenococcum geophilum 1.58 TaxID=794803 RepID=UPI00358DE821|nr:40S ribosomal protein S8 [Cenococcum geophilum 1.58]
MSLVNLAHVCSHLQNASKARLGLTSIPVSKLHVALMLGLQKEGFLSSVTLGGPSPPKPFLLQDNTLVEISQQKIRDEPWRAFPQPDKATNSPIPEPVKSAATESIEANYEEPVPDNPAKRRLWLGLKYWNNEPVLSKMKLVSKPTKRIWLNSTDIAAIIRGRDAGYVKGLSKPGECLFVTTDRGILEARECAEKRIGGMMLVKVV